MQLYKLLAGVLIPLTAEEEAQYPLGWPLRVVNGKPVPLSQVEIDARTAEEQVWTAGATARVAEATRCASLDAATAADTTLSALRRMTSDELDIWFNANVTDLASARTMLRRMFKIMVRRCL